MPVIQVEYYGVPRLKAGIASQQVEADSVADLFNKLHTANPSFAEACLDDGQLASEYLLNINGKEFTRNSTIPFNEGDVVLILSADVGG